MSGRSDGRGQKTPELLPRASRVTRDQLPPRVRVRERVQRKKQSPRGKKRPLPRLLLFWRKRRQKPGQKSRFLHAGLPNFKAHGSRSTVCAPTPRLSRTRWSGAFRFVVGRESVFPSPFTMPSATLRAARSPNRSSGSRRPNCIGVIAGDGNDPVRKMATLAKFGEQSRKSILFPNVPNLKPTTAVIQ